MGNTSLIRTALLIALITAFGLAAAGQAPAADPRLPATDAGTPVIKATGGGDGSQFLPLGIGKSVVVDLPRDIKDAAA